MEGKLQNMEEAIINRRTERKKQQEAFEAQQRLKDEEERERIRQAKKGKAKASEFNWCHNILAMTNFADVTICQSNYLLSNPTTPTMTSPDPI